MGSSLRALVRAFRQPVSPETRERLDAARARLPRRYRTPNQLLGRQYAGCGATIGTMPRCDFACRGCYLGEDANRVPAATVAEIRRQLRAIRGWLGEGGNVQITDGEVTLRDTAELVEIIRYSRSIGLVPMVMTHGDAFRRRPGLLERLVTEGGLSEVSLHVDTTQRGRLGCEYKHARRESELLPLREELAELVRQVRRETGRTLEVASTFTVTRDNLDGVPGVVRWFCRNTDAFKLLSFQPVAQVGRTEDDIAGAVGVDELWARIAAGVYGDERRRDELLRHRGFLGHPDCSQFVQALVVEQAGRPPAFHPLMRLHDRKDAAILEEWVARFRGLTFRLDSAPRAAVRLCGAIRQAPGFFLLRLVPFLLRWVRRVDPDRPLRFCWRWLRGRASVRYLNIVSHHFMSRAQIESAAGRERVELCVFQVPIGDELVSMCEVNALGLRDRYYERLRQGDGASPAPRTAAAFGGGAARIAAGTSAR